ncbi:MAG: hypothetical protein H6810_12135 [Phycisphaeraceae bacterium]|nr:MAG: hypothetical protein H6810_12135 [Phycisphaeraceae bacterium]
MTTTGPAQSTSSVHTPLFDVAEIDLRTPIAGRTEIERLNPHRHEMALLDEVIWLSEDFTCALGLHRCRGDAFWVRGHFPGMPLMPGVLQIEAGAQLACFLWNRQQPSPRVAAFLRIEQAAFRRSVLPGEDLLILCKEVKLGRRRFISDVQGLVGDQLAFEARVSGMALDEHKAD